MGKISKKKSFMVLIAFFSTVVLGGSGWGMAGIGSAAKNDQRVQQKEDALIKNAIEEYMNKPTDESSALENKSSAEVKLIAPKKFKSEEGKYYLTAAGFVCGIVYAVGQSSQTPSNVTDYLFLGITRVMALAIGGIAGGLIGYGPDMLINYYAYNNYDVGWINARFTDNKEGLLDSEKIVNMTEDATLYKQPGIGEKEADINKGEYRRVIEVKTIDGVVWYKVKKKDKLVS